METYAIRVAGHLSRQRAHALGCDGLQLLPEDASLLTFTALDAATLYGVQARLRDAGLELLAAERSLAPAEERRGRVGTTTPKEASDVVD